MKSQKARRVTLGRLKPGVNAASLAETLRERILGGEFGEGAVLPPERDLVDKTGLGRGSVREALRVLEAEGLIRTKTGRNGGTFTTLPDESDLTRFVSVFVRGRRVPVRALIEARVAIESSLAYYAALNREPADIEALERTSAELEATPDGPHFARRNLAWHYCIATASRNELLVAFLASISSAIARESLAHARAFEADSAGEIRAAVTRAHRAITDAVVKGDAEAAKRRMERHLRAYADSAGAAEIEHIEIS
ncbi:MAG: FCD domain-containing protein [Candidatus Velthaea sp.]|jgi:DNA-binding FadR family transcriptional regulator